MEYIDHVMDLSDVLNTPGFAIEDRPILDRNVDDAKLELLYGQFADILLQSSTLRLPRIGSLDQIDDFTWEVAQDRYPITRMNSSASEPYRARNCQRRTELLNQRHPTSIHLQTSTSSISHTNRTTPSIPLMTADEGILQDCYSASSLERADSRHLP